MIPPSEHDGHFSVAVSDMNIVTCTSISDLPNFLNSSYELCSITMVYRQYLAMIAIVATAMALGAAAVVTMIPQTYAQSGTGEEKRKRACDATAGPGKGDFGNPPFCDSSG